MKGRSKEPSIDWQEKFIELIVVVIGITIAFLINRGYENYKDRRLEDQYLNSMNEELKTDIGQLDSLLQKLDAQNAIIQRLLNAISNNRLPNDSLIKELHGITSLYFFSPQQTTFFALKSSGDLHLIKDYTLRHAILDYYQELHGLDYLHKIITEYFNRYIIPIVINRLDLTHGKILDS